MASTEADGDNTERRRVPNTCAGAGPSGAALPGRSGLALAGMQHMPLTNAKRRAPHPSPPAAPHAAETCAKTCAADRASCAGKAVGLNDSHMDENGGWQWDYVDCMYFTMATLTTVGYGDHSTLSQRMRVITAFFGLIGVLVIANSIGVIADWIADRAKKTFYQRQRGCVDARIRVPHPEPGPARSATRPIPKSARARRSGPPCMRACFCAFRELLVACVLVFALWGRCALRLKPGCSSWRALSVAGC